MSWLKAWVAKLLGVQLVIRKHEFTLRGERLERFGPEHYKTWGNLFALIPGLEDSWYSALGEAIGEMAKLPAKEEFHLERLRLCQRVVDIWQNLGIPTAAAAQLKDYLKALEEQQAPKRVTPAGAQNVIPNQ